MSTSQPPNRTPRYRPAPGAYRPGMVPASPPASEDLRRIQLAKAPRCQWQARAVRCVTEAVNVVRSREGVLRSTCADCFPKWLRTGATELG